MYENPLSGDDEVETEMEIEGDGMEVEVDVVGGATPGKGPGSGQSKPKIDRGDNFVLHFYDLAARKPHSLYQFVKA